MSENNLEKKSWREKGNLPLLGISLGGGLLAAILTLYYLIHVKGSEVQMLVATKDMSAGSLASKSQFQIIKISGQTSAIKSAFITDEDWPAFEQQPLSEPLQAGELLQIHHFRLSGEAAITGNIPKDKRAIAINVRDDEQSVAYLLRPEMGVDVLGLIGTKSHLLKAHARVLAVGQSSILPEKNEHAMQFSSITILLSETELMDFNTNRHLANDKLTVALAGTYDAAREQKALPALTQPDPSKLPETMAEQAQTAMKDVQ